MRAARCDLLDVRAVLRKRQRRWPGMGMRRGHHDLVRLPAISRADCFPDQPSQIVGREQKIAPSDRNRSDAVIDDENLRFQRHVQGH